MEKIKIIIGGTPYTIATDSGAEYTSALALEIEQKINAIMKQGVLIAPSQATVLALLDYADEAKRLSQENENMRSQLKEYLADAAQAKSERDMLRRELAKIKKVNGDF